MNSRPDLRIASQVETLRRLKQAVADFAKRESLLTRDLNNRRQAFERKYRQGQQTLDAAREAETTGAATHYAEEEARLREVHEKRRLKIVNTKAALLKALPAKVKEAERKWIGDQQVRHFRAEKTLAAGLEASSSEFAVFSKKLAAEGVALNALHVRCRKALGAFGSLSHLLHAAPAGEKPAADRDKLFAEMEAQMRLATERIEEVERQPLPKILRFTPIFVWLPVIIGGGVAGAFLGGPQMYVAAGAGAVVLCLALIVAYVVGLGGAKPSGTAAAAAFVEARRCYEECRVAADARFEQENQRLRDECAKTNEDISAQWSKAGEKGAVVEGKLRAKIEQQAPRALQRNASTLLPQLARLTAGRTARAEQAQTDFSARQSRIDETYATESAAWAADETAQWAKIESDWQTEVAPLCRAVAELQAAAEAQTPVWDRAFVEHWQPAAHFTPSVPFGRLELDLARTPEGLPKDPRLALPGPAQVSIPLALEFPAQGSLFLETASASGPAALGPFNNIMLRLLSATPPGKIDFTIIDPVQLGQNFAGIMHLADYEESLINRRIWTQRDQIEERLAEMSEHIEKVIQMYLRNEYATITEYNEQAGSVAEKYHFLVVADFPTNFTESAAKRLRSIALSGPRCGIFTLIHWDRRNAPSDGHPPDELRQAGLWVRAEGDQFILGNTPPPAGVALRFDAPPADDLAVELVHKIGKASIDSNRVEVPFSQISPKPEEFWTTETTSELRVPIGRTGATKLQYLAIGKGTRQHALFAGKTGSGKSTLFHVIITNLALYCSPEQVEFYLIDFKKGVEFKCYASKRLPHARVVAIESDREFGLNVLQRVDDELKRRGDLFRELGVQDVPGYKKAGGREPMPRSLLMIDEFQEFFVEDDAIAQGASLLFDRIVRQGRAFGIHVLLGSQTLGGAYSLARATLGQMVIRVALQCNEADAYLIMDENNPAPRLLTRPGEGIYNDSAGAVEGNSPFQVVWLPDDERDALLDRVRELAEQHHDRHEGPIVFEGNAPANVRENLLLRDALAATPAFAPAAARFWLGAPNSIKGPTEGVFHRQSGSHLLVVGQREEAALTLLGLSMVALAAQFPPGAARFLLLHAATPETREAAFIDQLVAAIPQDAKAVRNQDIDAVFADLGAQFRARSSGDEQNGPAIFLFIHGLQKFKKLRHEDDFSFSSGDGEGGAKPDAQLTELITDGSAYGMHVAATLDTFNNVGRFLSRKALSEFGMRIVFQMSANDSASLIDSPKASALGLHRALFYSEQAGTLETFRPYAAPDADWLRQAGEKLARTRSVANAPAKPIDEISGQSKDSQPQKAVDDATVAEMEK